jgi:hypothetical protein
VLARALTAYVFSAGADGQFGVGASDQFRPAVLCRRRRESNLDLARIRVGRQRRLDLTLNSLVREPSAGQRGAGSEPSRYDR